MGIVRSWDRKGNRLDSEINTGNKDSFIFMKYGKLRKQAEISCKSNAKFYIIRFIIQSIDISL
jgi:hypothetical protein